MRTRKTVIHLQMLCAILMVSSIAYAQNPSTGAERAYPEKPVRMVVPFPPGGAIDIVARLITAKLSESIGVQFIVDNRSGAGGAIGTENVARSAPDGYSLLFSSTSPMSVNPHITSNIRYNPITSFTPVAMVGYAPQVLAIHPSLPVQSVSQLIAMAKAKPGELSYASSGVGTIIHITSEYFAQSAGIHLLHVPYKGAAPAVIDTISGQVTMLFAAYPSISAHVKAGKLKALAVTSPRRLEMAPDLPAIAETLPDFESRQWWAVSGPAGMPERIVAQLNKAVNHALLNADVRKNLAAVGAEPGGGTPNDLAMYLKNDYEKWGRLIKSIGIQSQ
ncbi:MAG: tripartite tricarboxylate transporter substrate binding protein [Candidatus Latescibacterota bacterium]